MLISLGGVTTFMDQLAGPVCNGNVVNCDYSGDPTALMFVQVGRICFALTLVTGAAFNMMPLRDQVILAL